jgi:hypothetical protein
MRSRGLLAPVRVMTVCVNFRHPCEIEAEYWAVALLMPPLASVQQRPPSAWLLRSRGASTVSGRLRPLRTAHRLRSFETRRCGSSHGGAGRPHGSAPHEWGAGRAARLPQRPREQGRASPCQESRHHHRPVEMDARRHAGRAPPQSPAARAGRGHSSRGSTGGSPREPRRRVGPCIIALRRLPAYAPRRPGARQRPRA